MTAGAVHKPGQAGSPAITRIRLGPGGEWVLVAGALRYAPRAVRAQARQRAWDLVTGHGPGGTAAGPGGLAVVRVPEADFPPLLGAAVLRYSRFDGTVIYCPGRQITDIARGSLEDLLGAALSLSRSLPRGRAPAVRLPLVEHDEMPRLLDPVGPVRVRPRGITAWVCDQHLTAEMAHWLGALCTSQGSYLAPAGPPEPAASSSRAFWLAASPSPGAA